MILLKNEQSHPNQQIISYFELNQLLFYFANLGMGLFHHGHPPGTATFNNLKEITIRQTTVTAKME